MEKAIERLRTQKAEYDLEQVDAGRSAGTNWARDNATYRELVELSLLGEDDFTNVAGGYLIEALDPQHVMSGEEIADCMGVSPNEFGDDHFTRAFVEGAREFFAEVAAQL